MVFTAVVVEAVLELLIAIFIYFIAELQTVFVDACALHTLPSFVLFKLFEELYFLGGCVWV